MLGTERKCEAALDRCEDSKRPNTACIERLNLFLRFMCSYAEEGGPGMVTETGADGVSQQQSAQHVPLRVLETAPGTDSVLEVVHGDRVVHRFALTQVPGGLLLDFEYARPPARLGNHGWLVELSFGVPRDMEILSLFLGPRMEPRFYFAGW